MTPAERGGWAIQVNSGRFIGVARFIGVGWFAPEVPWDRYAGHNLMVWPTRREARTAMPRIRRSYPDAQVVRVVVTVTRPGDGRAGAG